MSIKFEGVMTEKDLSDLGAAIKSHVSAYEWQRIEPLFSRMWTSHEALRTEAIRLKEKVRCVYCIDYTEHKVRTEGLEFKQID